MLLLLYSTQADAAFFSAHKAQFAEILHKPQMRAALENQRFNLHSKDNEKIECKVTTSALREIIWIEKIEKMTTYGMKSLFVFFMGTSIYFNVPINTTADLMMPFIKVGFMSMVFFLYLQYEKKKNDCQAYESIARIIAEQNPHMIQPL